MKFLVLILSSFFVILCTSKRSVSFSEQITKHETYAAFSPSLNCLPEREQVAYQLMNDFGQIHKIPGLHLIGSGLIGDKVNNKLGVLDIHLQYDKIFTIDSARQLAVLCMNNFLSFINDKRKLAPHLTKFPISHDQVSIMLSGADSSDETYIATVILRRGKISYYDNHVKPPTFDCTFKETYEEAIRMLNIP